MTNNNTYPFVGFTESGDPACSNVWVTRYQKLNCVGAVVISKGMPLKFGRDFMLANKEHMVFHATTTGWGGTRVEPGVKEWHERLDDVDAFVEEGFPKDHVVIRVDPIPVYPDGRGFTVAKAVMIEVAKRGYKNIKYSYMDVQKYPHLKRRYTELGIEIPIEIYECKRELIEDFNEFMLELEKEFGIRFTCCAEHDFVPKHHDHPCLDGWFFDTCNLDRRLMMPTRRGQRQECNCAGNKKELMPYQSTGCAHQCAYCYWAENMLDSKMKQAVYKVHLQSLGLTPETLTKLEEETKQLEEEAEEQKQAPAFHGDKAFLSNMFPIRMIVNGIEYTCLEAAFQSFKTTDLDERKKFSGISGKEAKTLGHRVKLREDWESWKEDCMLQLLRIKFSEPDFAKALCAIEGPIVETNTRSIYNGVGKNRLGKLLEQVRTELSCGFKVWKGFWTPEDCVRHTNDVFVFGDNDLRKGTAGQAVIRNCVNSIGVRTKRLPAMTEDAFYSDLEEEKQKIREDLLKVAQAGLTETVWLPEAGLGTGLAKLPEKSPMLFKFLTRAIELMKNEGAQAAIDFLNADITSICVTGHRPNKLFGYNDNDPRYNTLRSALDQAITAAAQKGSVVAYTGMALGVDTIFAEECLKLKKQFDIKLVAAVPFKGQEGKWPEQSKKHYHDLLSQVDEIVYVSDPGYAAWKMQKRNEYMVNHSDLVIAVFDGTSGGTANCVNYAKRQNKQIYIINPRNIK